MTTVLDKVVAAVEDQQRQAEQEFRVLVGHIADGHEPKPAAVTATLTAAGKTIEDLRVEVDLLRQRRELRRQVAAAPDLHKRQGELQKGIAAADAELDRAAERHRQKTSPLAWELDELAERLRQAEAAKGELFRTAPKRIRDELSAVGADVENMLVRQGELRGTLERLQYEFRQLERQQQQREEDPAMSGSEQQERRELRRRDETYRQNIRRQVAEVERELRTLQDQGIVNQQRRDRLVQEAETV